MGHQPINCTLQPNITSPTRSPTVMHGRDVNEKLTEFIYSITQMARTLSRGQSGTWIRQPRQVGIVFPDRLLTPQGEGSYIAVPLQRVQQCITCVAILICKPARAA